MTGRYVPMHGNGPLGVLGDSLSHCPFMGNLISDNIKCDLAQTSRDEKREFWRSGPRN